MLSFKEFNSSSALVKSILDFQKHQKSQGVFSFFRKKWASLRHRYWSIITSSVVSKYALIHSDLQLPHPNGVVVHDNAKIGSGCMIMQQVTIGQLADEAAVPVIGNGVYIGAGAKVLGGIVIGEYAKIGANAVVLKDVPSYATAVGIPAIIKKTGLPPIS